MSRNYETVASLAATRNANREFFTANPDLKVVSWTVVNGIVLPSVAKAAVKQGLGLSRVGRAWTLDF